MLDNLLLSLNEVSNVLLPFMALVCLILLAMLLFYGIRFIKALPVTIQKVNETIENVNSTVSSANNAVDKLNAPLETLTNISQTVDVINRSATGIVSSVAGYTIKNSDAIIGWAKGMFGKNTDSDPVSEEEDFGIYE